ncbi:MAG: hypothetical protein GY820_10715 [Gammaproteobacteria bacterium]|nr:hypothetical protein [Gammaproteobacteria bacterium]
MFLTVAVVKCFTAVVCQACRTAVEQREVDAVGKKSSNVAANIVFICISASKKVEESSRVLSTSRRVCLNVLVHQKSRWKVVPQSVNIWCGR